MAWDQSVTSSASTSRLSSTEGISRGGDKSQISAAADRDRMTTAQAIQSFFHTGVPSFERVR